MQEPGSSGAPVLHHLSALRGAEELGGLAYVARGHPQDGPVAAGARADGVDGRHVDLRLGELPVQLGHRAHALLATHKEGALGAGEFPLGGPRELLEPRGVPGLPSPEGNNQAVAVAYQTNCDRCNAELVRNELKAYSLNEGASDVPRSAAVQFVVGALVSILTWWIEEKSKLSLAEANAIFRRLTIPAILGKP